MEANAKAMVTSATHTTLHPSRVFQDPTQPYMDHYYDQKNYYMFSTPYSYIYDLAQYQKSHFYYQMVDETTNEWEYKEGQIYTNLPKKEIYSPPLETSYGVSFNQIHPVQLLHQLFRKEAFVMEYERVNDGPYSQVQVTYKVNEKTYHARAARLKEARRLCAKKVLRDQFPYLGVEKDSDIPEPEYDTRQFQNKHPVQILYQIFKYQPMQIHCDEEGAAHFAKHIFTFIIQGKQFTAKAETIKEAKRRAAILALNEYFKTSKAKSNS